MHWSRKWQPTSVFLPEESQEQGSLVGFHLWRHTESDTTEVTYQQQKHTYFCFPGSSVVKNLPANAGDVGLIPGSGRSLGERNGNPLQCSCLGNSKDRRAWQIIVHGVTKSQDTTERLPFHFSFSCTGEGNGNPLQCSCLENPRDRGAWWAAVYRVTQSRTRLK